MNALIFLFIAELFVIAAMWHGKTTDTEKKSKSQPRKAPSGNKPADGHI
jgi:hypothetical protein